MRTLTTSMALGMALACSAPIGCGGSGGGGDSTPESVRDSIPEHGEDPGPQADQTFVGRVDGTDALIALVANDGAAAAYVCDGRLLSEWLLGRLIDGEISLEGEKGGSVEGSVSEGEVQGVLTHAGARHSFSGAQAVERQSGIYRSVEEEDGARIVSGWIFYEGELRGADEDSGKNVVGSISLGGVDTGTGSGTGLPPPSPSPAPVAQSCESLWCQHENTRCLILDLDEKKKGATKVQKKQFDSMIGGARKQLALLGEQLGDGGCFGNSSQCTSGYDSTSDVPDC